MEGVCLRCHGSVSLMGTPYRGATSFHGGGEIGTSGPTAWFATLAGGSKGDILGTGRGVCGTASQRGLLPLNVGFTSASASFSQRP